MTEDTQKPAEDPILSLIRSIGGVSPALGPSLAAFLGGAVLLLDDAADFGKLGDERRPHRQVTKNMPSLFPDFQLPPPTPHHWLLGAVLMIGGVAGLGLSLVDLLASDPKRARGMLEKVKELEIARKALPPGELEKLLAVKG